MAFTTYKRSSEQGNIRHYRAQIVDSSLVIGTMLGLATILITKLDGDNRALGHQLIDILGIGLLIVVSIKRKSLRIRWKAGALIGVVFLITMAETFRIGLLGDNYLLLPMIPFFLILAFDKTTTVIFSFLTLFIYLTIGGLFTSDVLTLNSGIEAHLEFSDWIEKGLVLVIVSAVIVFTLINFDQNTSKFIESINEKNEELKTREANLSAITESTNNVIGLFDANKHVVAFNQAFADYIFATDDVVIYEGIDLLNHINQAQSEVFRKYMDRVLKGEKFKATIEYPVGEDLRSFMLSFNPVYRKHRIIGFSLFAEDISELRKIQQQLEKYNIDLETLVQERTQELESKNKALHDGNIQLEKAFQELRETQGQLLQADKMSSLGVLAAGVGHEINNPLNFIFNGVKTIESQLTDDELTSVEDLAPFFDVIYDGVDRASKIVKSLSHFSRKATDLNETCDVHAILDNCLTILRSETKNKAQIIKQFAKKELIITGSEAKLHQVFLNLLFNASQAIKEQGQITIITEHEENWINVSIADNGCGISEENLKKISDPFYTTKAAGEGTGLGLFITYGVIEEHDGEIKVFSKEGEGSTFTLSFPLKKLI
ncbi:MAG: ATP-binding protein [Cytophagales bacterium]|nr:ATP-binding protein [Cytophagales bacterium]